MRFLALFSLFCVLSAPCRAEVCEFKAGVERFGLSVTDGPSCRLDGKSLKKEACTRLITLIHSFQQGSEKKRINQHEITDQPLWQITCDGVRGSAYLVGSSHLEFINGREVRKSDHQTASEKLLEAVWVQRE
jgi:hypothetical protein